MPYRLITAHVENAHLEQVHDIRASEASLAGGALLLLTVNIVCVNLSAKVVFWVQKIRPRQWYQQKKAEKAMRLYVAIWLVTLAVLVGIIYLRQTIDKALEAVV